MNIRVEQTSTLEVFRNSCRCKQPRGKGTVFGPQDARHSYVIFSTQNIAFTREILHINITKNEISVTLMKSPKRDINVKNALQVVNSGDFNFERLVVEHKSISFM